MLKVDLAPWPALAAYQARVAARPAVHAALVAEGLVKEAAPATRDAPTTLAGAEPRERATGTHP